MSKDKEKGYFPVNLYGQSSFPENPMLTEI